MNYFIAAKKLFTKSLARMPVGAYSIGEGEKEMLFNKDDLIIAAFSFAFSIVFISMYWSLAVICEVFFS